MPATAEPRRAPVHAPSSDPDTATPARSTPWWTASVDEVLASLGTTSDGLPDDEAHRRLAQAGPNALPTPPRPSPLRLLARQFTDFMILVLLAAAGLSAALGDTLDAVAILAILAVNGVIGFVQEYRAERALDALKALAAPTAAVRRAGRALTVAAADLVPGDVLHLEAGTIVPADARLLEAAQLRVQEAALTGESEAAVKTAAPMEDARAPLGDRLNMVFRGTTVVHGRGLAVVVGTGARTEMGRIAELLATTEEGRTPLQRRLAQLGRRLATAALLACLAILVMGLLRGDEPLVVLLTAISLAVAAIPEALPAVVTIALALGARQMVARHALVRRLPAVETLGSVTWICSDKTGTLTRNRMRVEAVHHDGRRERTPGRGPVADELLLAMALCNDARPGPEGTLTGDPTEVALAEAAREAGFDKRTLEGRYPRVAELPFDAARKCMTTVHRAPGGGFVSYTKGAAEAILPSSARVAARGDHSPEALLPASEELARDGLRVLVLATRRWAEEPLLAPEVLERGLEALGLAALLDPPRPEARDAVATCRTAGIVPVMITGDHPLTARAVAERVGLLDEGGAVTTGRELEGLSPDELAARVVDVRVFARVAPEQKLEIVQALQKRGELVAMTGDGVNDAPALRQADIGVAMGVTGTDAAREASAMVLLDDNFATIVGAVREGRRVYDNLRRFVRYAVATNSAEVATIALAPLFGLPLPLLPLQILWVNLVTDSLPGLALAAEPAEPDVMERPPRPPDESLFARGLGVHVLWVGALMSALVLGTQAWSLRAGSEHWQTLTFTSLCFCQLAHVLAIRSERTSLLRLGLFSNRPLLGAVALTIGLQLALLYIPWLSRVFRTVPLNAVELLGCFAVAAIVLFAVELEKWWRRRAPRRD